MKITTYTKYAEATKKSYLCKENNRPAQRSCFPLKEVNFLNYNKNFTYDF